MNDFYDPWDPPAWADEDEGYCGCDECNGIYPDPEEPEEDER